MTEQLVKYLENRGYIVKRTNLSEFIVLFSLSSSVVNSILIADCTKNAYITEDQLAMIRDRIRGSYGNSVDVHVLTLIIGGDTEQARRLAGEDQMCWYIDVYQLRLIIYETQISDYYGLKSILETFLENGFVQQDTVEENKQIRESASGRVSKYLHIPKAYITLILVVLNVILYFLCTVTGETLYNMGMMYGPYIVEKGEIYRLITAMFLHGSVEHLFSNMLVLYAIGEMIEGEFGHAKFTILYFVAGIGGGLTSMLYAYASNQLISSIGASGAIFGLIGALLILVLKNHGSFKTVSLPRIIFAIGYSVYSGFRAENIDNAAHIGGLLTGFLAAFLLLLYRSTNCKKGRRRG